MTAAPEVALRALEPEDCEIVRSWIESEDAVWQWSGPWDFTWPLRTEQLLRDLACAHERRRLFAVVAGPGGDLVGHAMLTIQPHHGLGVIGRVAVDPARRRGGFGTALMREVVRVGFDELGLHRLQLNVYDFNASAIACYQRVGFVIEGRSRHSTKGRDGYWSGYVMALLEDEYRTQRAPVPGATLIRPARLADGPAVAGLLTELGYPQPAQEGGAWLARWAGDPRAIVLIAELDERPAGLIAACVIPYTERSGSFVRVVALVVDPACRRTGAGRRLLRSVEAWAAELGCRDVEVTSRRTRDDAHAFYRELGFEDVGERAVLFRRSLADAR